METLKENKWLVIGLVLIVAALMLQSGGGVAFGPAEVSVLIVEETAERPLLPESQLAVLTSTTIRDWAKAHCDKDTAGNPEFRVLDKDADVSRMGEKWRERMEFAKSQRLPYLAVSTGRSGTHGDLPLTVDETLSVLKKWGGE